jgi:hypothetical protein
MLQPSRKPRKKALEYHPDKILETKRQKKNLRKLLRLTRF